MRTDEKLLPFKIKFLVDEWYDGCDNPINTMSIEDFVKN